MTTKQCRKCKEVKDLTTDFFPRNNASKDKFDSMCKACWKLRSAERSRGNGRESAAKTVARKLIEGERRGQKGWQQTTTVDVSKSLAVKMAGARKSYVREKPPRGVTLQFPARLADIPGGGVQYRLYEGTDLEQAVSDFRTLTEFTGPLTVYIFVRSTGRPLYYVRVPSTNQPPTPVKGRGIHKKE